jgi:polysaccharide biosynthesis protein PslH
VIRGRTIHLLQLAPRFSAQPTMGAELRNFHLARRLSRHMRVTHLGFGSPAPAPSSGSEEPRFIAVPRLGAYRPIDLLRGAAGSVPFAVLNYTRAEMTAALRQLMAEERFDIVQLESVHLAGYLPAIRSAPHPPHLIVCDWHNIESEVLRRYSETTRSIARRIYARHASRKLEQYERRFLGQCALHIAVSGRDADTLRRFDADAQVAVIENGVDALQFADADGESDSRRRRVLFVGAMDYHANIEGAIFFARDVWPELAKSLPDAVFTIVGRNPAATVRSLADGERIEVTGTVPDVRPYYRDAWLAVVPLRVGGGTRLKILEAMAAGVPVISTALGAEGLSAKPGQDYLLADSAAEMAHAALTLARDPAHHARIAAAGRELARSRYDWGTLGDRLAERLLALVEARD